MVRLTLLIAVAVLLFLTACSHQNNQGDAAGAVSNEIKVESQASYPFPLIIWNKHIYRVTNDKVTDIDKEIGEIKNFSAVESEGQQDNYSNYYPKGTKIFSIVNIDTSVALAVKTGENEFVKAIPNTSS
ncbi:hypothetical protein PA598K_06231 [Paenibacillus sp. 598K]|uniref:hypothetical protein n=1 Tax=Paenibacillus sp. 598K TaxID=1117987 RepID=UPI000FF9D96F|nr:hypothetical protein [Paenibacillus sp. 598K]GBF77669.1 hypothetical protein PA598K_06231 [Paenibacillus sp. 598K]